LLKLGDILLWFNYSVRLIFLNRYGAEIAAQALEHLTDVVARPYFTCPAPVTED
jgi:hypothetical protein